MSLTPEERAKVEETARIYAQVQREQDDAIGKDILRRGMRLILIGFGTLALIGFALSAFLFHR